MLIKIRNVRTNVKQIGRKNVYVEICWNWIAYGQTYIDLPDTIWIEVQNLGEVSGLEI